MSGSGIYVRAKTPEGWASVLVEDLDERSFRRFVLDRLHVHGVVISALDETEREREREPYTAPVPRAAQVPE